MSDKFLTIVIPAYNCHSTLTNALASIAMQKFCEEIEVIIADDCSSEDYTDIIDRFNSILDIKLLRCEKNSGPGVARQLGIDNAAGKYVTFLDSDDTIAFGAYLNVKEVLVNDEPDMLITDFYEQRDDFKTYVPHQQDTVWVHGKYYKMDFLREKNIRCHDTLRTHEDIYFNHLCLNSSDKIRVANILTYIWNFKDDSLTRRMYNGSHTYVEQYLCDYVESTIGPCRKLIAQDPMTYKEKMKNLMVLHPVYLYFYIESFKYNEPGTWYTHNLNEVKKTLDLIKETYNMDYKDVYYYVKNSNVFGLIRGACEKGVGPFIEQDTFEQFLKECSEIKM